MYSKIFLLLLSIVWVSGLPLIRREEIASNLDEEEDVATKGPEVYGLSDNVVPILYHLYRLKIVPDLTTFIFRGIVKNTILVKRPAHKIGLHGKKLKKTNSRVIRRRRLTDREDNQYKFHDLNELILNGRAKYTIGFEFDGVLKDSVKRFFKSSYLSSTFSWLLATTQFETMYIREAFLSFDEPWFRAKFSISVVYSPNHQKSPPSGVESRMDAVDDETLEKLEAGFATLQNSDSKSLLKKYLTREIFENLKCKKTSYGSTLLDSIQSGIKNLDSGVGLYAPDPEAYRVFAELFNPVIKDYHKGFGENDQHPAPFFGDPNDFGTLDPKGKLVISTRIRVGRSMKGYPFNPCLSEQQYREMEQIATQALTNMPGDLAGEFYPLTGMSKDVQQRLIDDHFLFKEGDRFLQAANANRFWPTGRGIFHNDAKTFLVWVNEEDHMRVISMQMGGNVSEIYGRLLRGLNEIQNQIEFEHDSRLGFLTFCPTNLGTTIRASVLIRIPKLLEKEDVLNDISTRHNLQVRGTRGEHSAAEGGIVDVSNKRRMGLTEYEAVKEMYEGVGEIIEKEYELMNA